MTVCVRPSAFFDCLMVCVNVSRYLVSILYVYMCVCAMLHVRTFT